ncbi:hypothetical protein EYF80_008716 [Liparis tanakae]|uniref:Uncharacterized protein n=1 Tax=Liparis tanakae TaxID=230148 RepID=A0A4Z2ISU9_9TELE|nr:hypothetical protein EYF80_008716 [Liparis tanakae]
MHPQCIHNAHFYDAAHKARTRPPRCDEWRLQSEGLPGSCGDTAPIRAQRDSSSRAQSILQVRPHTFGWLDISMSEESMSYMPFPSGPLSVGVNRGGQEDEEEEEGDSQESFILV